MREFSTPSFWNCNNPILWGIGCTFLVILSAIALGSIADCQLVAQEVELCKTKWSHFLSAPPNEIGDTLAGFAGALAFIWIIATVWLQSIELSEQRKELTKQREATQWMAEAQREQVNLMQVQSEIFKDEHRQRLEEYAGKESEAIHVQLHSILVNNVLGLIELQEKGSAPIAFKILDHIDATYSSGNGVKSQTVVKLIEHILEALRNIAPDREDKLSSYSSPQINRVRVVLRDLNRTLEGSSPAIKRKLSSESLKIFEFELTKYFGDVV